MNAIYKTPLCVTSPGSIPKEEGKKDTAQEDLGQNEAKDIELLLKSYGGFLYYVDPDPDNEDFHQQTGSPF